MNGEIRRNLENDTFI